MRINEQIQITECPGVYPPREDTFLLLESVEVERDEEVLEIGCGTGIISIHCAIAGAIVTAVDINDAAVQCTRTNAERNCAHVNVIRSDLFSAITGKFDTIIFNPPYLPVEQDRDESVSWAGGRGGVEILARFLYYVPQFLKETGRVFIVVSSLMNQDTLEKVLAPFKVDCIARRRMFFEELAVLRLRLP
ncbi:MAG: methyltransferase [Methanomassiliicoccales archaeon]|jgi:release factor glutamine methyltransferase|nr:methyltransferase [Methanomassiliicoccales archaeon]